MVGRRRPQSSRSPTAGAAGARGLPFSPAAQQAVSGLLPQADSRVPTVPARKVRLQSYLRPREWSARAPGHDGKSRAGSQSLTAASMGQACYRLVPAPVRTGAPSPSCARSSRVVGRSFAFLSRWTRRRPARCATPPRRCARACWRARRRPCCGRARARDRAPRCAVDRARRVALLRVQEHGPGAVDQQHAQVRIAALADRARGVGAGRSTTRAA